MIIHSINYSPYSNYSNRKYTNSRNTVHFGGVKEDIYDNEYIKKLNEQQDKLKNPYNINNFDEKSDPQNSEELPYSDAMDKKVQELIAKKREEIVNLQKGMWNFITRKYEKQRGQIEQEINLIRETSNKILDIIEQKDKESLELWRQRLEVAKQLNYSQSTVMMLENKTKAIQKKLEIMDQKKQTNANKGFSKLGGYTEEKTILKSGFIDNIDNEKAGINTSDNIPNAILIYGPSGCGKTTFSKALAEEADCNYRIFKLRGSQEEKEQRLLDEFYGYIKTDSHNEQTAVKGLLETANEEFLKTNRRTIVLIDEFDRFFNKDTSRKFIKSVKKLLETCGQQHVTLFLATNNPLKIPYELRNSHRTGIIINLDPPNEINTAEVIEYYLKNYDKEKLDYDKIISKLFEYAPDEVYSNSHLKTICEIATDEIKPINKPLTTEMLLEAIDTYNDSSTDPNMLRITKQYLDQYENDKKNV